VRRDKRKTWFVVISLAAYHSGKVEQRQTTVHTIGARDEEECYWAALHSSRAMFEPPLPEGVAPITIFYLAMPS
jgi:hypothetical protein